MKRDDVREGLDAKACGAPASASINFGQGQNELNQKVDLIGEIDRYIAQGGKWQFWACPVGCDGMVDWKDGVAACRVCGRTSRTRSDPKRNENHLAAPGSPKFPKSEEGANK